MSSERYPFKLEDKFKPGRWYPARWKASREDIEALGGRICGPAEVRIGGGGTAGHVQSSPTPSESLPTDLLDGSGLVRSGPSGESAAGGGDSAASKDDPAWGVRLWP